MRVVLAGRLSQLQAGQTGMESREAEMIRWAEYNSHEIVAITEDWQSGTTPLHKRRDLRSWVTDPGKLAIYDALVAFEGSRLSRGPKAMVNEIEKWAADNGKMILTVRDGLRFPAEGNEGIIWDVVHRQNHQQWLDTSRMYKNMQKHLKDKGYLVGRPCWPFDVTGKDDHKTLVPSAERADYTRRAIARFFDGDPLRAICEWLDSEGQLPPGGGKWSPVSLSQIFRNEALVGRRRERCAKCLGRTGKRSCDRCKGSGTGRTILRHEPVINRETWDKLQTLLDKKAKRKGIAPKNTAMLTGVAMCGLCGGPMYRYAAYTRLADGTRRQYLYYRCHGTDREPSTCTNSYPLELLEQRVNRYVTRTLGRWDRYEYVTTPGRGYDDEIADVERDLRELDFDAPDFEERQTVLLAERRRLRELPSTTGKTEKVPTGDTIGQHWATLTDDASKRATLLKMGLVVRAVRGKGERKDRVWFEMFTNKDGLGEFLPDGLLDDDGDDEIWVPEIPD